MRVQGYAPYNVALSDDIGHGSHKASSNIANVNLAMKRTEDVVAIPFHDCNLSALFVRIGHLTNQYVALDRE